MWLSHVTRMNLWYHTGWPNGASASAVQRWRHVFARWRAVDWSRKSRVLVVRMSHVTRMNESCHIYEWGRNGASPDVVQRWCFVLVCWRPGARHQRCTSSVNILVWQWCHVFVWWRAVVGSHKAVFWWCEWVMSRVLLVRISHVTCMNGSWQTYECVLSAV